MTRYALKIEYHGARFFGWQRQKTHPSVQQTVEEALAKIEPAPVIIEGAGRTDTGVHALGQVAHCDLQKDWTSAKLCAAMNYHLRPYRVVIKAAARVADDFHARFSAIERRYMFRLLTARMPSVFDAGWFGKYRMLWTRRRCNWGRITCLGRTILPRFAPPCAKRAVP